ncbi:hypothetical protein V6Z11_D08G129500 [Gossypium hirsutum]
MDRSQILFYAYTRAYNNSIVATLCQLSPTQLTKFPVFPPIIREYEPSSDEDDLGDRDRSVESPPIMHVSDVGKEEESRDIEEHMRRIDNLVEGEIIAGKETPIVEEEVVVEEEYIRVEVVNEKVKEENIETKAVEKESVEDKKQLIMPRQSRNLKSYSRIVQSPKKRRESTSKIKSIRRRRKEEEKETSCSHINGRGKLS